MMKPRIPMHEAATKQRDHESETEAPFMRCVSLVGARILSTSGTYRHFVGHHLYSFRRSHISLHIQPKTCFVAGTFLLRLRASCVAIMVFRITITGKEKDIVVDIEDSGSQFGSAKLDGEKLRKSDDDHKVAKRSRDSIDDVQGSRRSPYRPRTPVDEKISRVVQTNEPTNTQLITITVARDLKTSFGPLKSIRVPHFHTAVAFAVARAKGWE